MLPLEIADGRLRFGGRLAVSFQRTLRVPDDGRTYPLPPGLGLIPIHAVGAFTSTAPRDWRRDGFFVPLYQREAVWIGFDAASWHPHAVKVGVGSINAISGEPWSSGLGSEPQDYLVCPPQLWLDGVNAGRDHIRQFVAMPHRAGFTIEEQLAGTDEGTITLEVFAPRAGRFPEAPPPPDEDGGARVMSSVSLGMAAGGRIDQRAYRDPYGVGTWDTGNSATATVHLLSADGYRAVTGLDAPPTPVDAATYTAHGFPWFEIYDEQWDAIPGGAAFERVESVGELERRRGSAGDTPVDVPPDQVRRIRPDFGPGGENDD